MHNNRNRRLSMQCSNLGSGTGMRLMGPVVSSSHACRPLGNWANCLLESMRLRVRVHRRVFMGGRAVPSQPCYVLLDLSMVGANPQHPSCWQAVGPGAWFESHLSTGVNPGQLHWSPRRQGRCWGPSSICTCGVQERLGSVFRLAAAPLGWMVILRMPCSV